MALAEFLRREYRVATGQNLPTGHSWPQLSEFLLESKRGTSEQFAAAYVALARIKGIPARLVVGFRAPADRRPGERYTVRNEHVLAWPEVAVEGVGWVPLDPSGTATAAGSGPARGLAAATEEVRATLPPPDQLRDAPVAPEPVAASSGSGGDWSFPFLVLLAVPVGGALVWVAGVPLVTALRARRRRRRPGAGAVIGAWEEARDRLRAYGVPVSTGMTVRDLARPPDPPAPTAGCWRACARSARPSTTHCGPALPRSGHRQAGVGAVRSVRQGLARRGLRARIRAALNPVPLRAPR
ncbi:transglutaminase domain-containing protein [Prauserella oleivorans]